MDGNFSDKAETNSFEHLPRGDDLILNYLVMIVLSIVAIFATIANTTTIIIYGKRRLATRYALVINLAVAELATPLFTYWMVISSSFSATWVYGEMGCIAYAFINGFCGMASIASLTLMAVERYVTLCLSENIKDHLQKAQIPLIGATWLYATIMSAPPLFGWGRYVHDVYPASCTFDFYSHDFNSRSFMTYLITCGFAIPVLAIISLYARIHCTISSYRKMVKSIINSNEGGSRKLGFRGRILSQISFRNQSNTTADAIAMSDVANVDATESNANSELKSEENLISQHQQMDFRLHRAELQFAKRTFLVIVGFLTCWTPYALLTIMCQLRVEGAFSTTASAITLLLAKSSVAINPIIYAFKDRTYRSELNELVGSLSRIRQSITGDMRS